MNVAIKDSVATEFAQVDDVIVELLQSDVEMVENIGHYIVKAGGKRMRPLLVLCRSAAPWQAAANSAAVLRRIIS